MRRLKGLTQLQTLDLRSTQVTDAGLEQHEGPNATPATLPCTYRVDRRWVRALKDLTQLRELSLDDTKVTDAGLEGLNRLRELRKLSLDDTQVTDGTLRILSD